MLGYGQSLSVCGVLSSLERGVLQKLKEANFEFVASLLGLVKCLNLHGSSKQRWQVGQFEFLDSRKSAGIRHY